MSLDLSVSPASLFFGPCLALFFVFVGPATVCGTFLSAGGAREGRPLQRADSHSQTRPTSQKGHGKYILKKNET